ncbi:tyrosine-type recombinase/integrase [Thomasclavelia cocleata]|nr:site-specific integrase [Thomasclavelia cocleata]
MKVNDIYEEYINFTPLSLRTRILYHECYNSFWKKIIGNLDTSKIDYNIIQSGINTLLKSYQYNTVKIYKCSILKFLQIVQLKDNIRYSWLNCIYAGKPPKKKDFDSERELYEFYELIVYIRNSKTKLKKQYETIMWIGFFTGLRIGETLALSKKDINLKRGEIQINKNLTYKKINGKITPFICTVKTSSGCRVVYIPNKLKEILSEYLLSSNNMLFTNDNGDYIASSTVSSFIWHFAKPRKYNIHYHSLRILFTKIMLDNNANLDSVRSLLGHANTTTTLNIYLRSCPRDRKNDIDKVFNSKIFFKQIEGYCKNTVKI